MSSEQRKQKKLARRKADRTQKQAHVRSSAAPAKLAAEVVELSILREVAYIIERAQAGECRVVTLGDFVLFSTHGQDAWLLEPRDQTAVCLARNGMPQPYCILETPTVLSIEWHETFAIRDDLFLVRQQSGTISAIEDYPINELHLAIHRVRRS
jgi:hypothetical protein